MSEPPVEAYGQGRIRTSVSYGEVERAAIAILKSERRPTVETVREALGRGSPDTIGSALKRFWRDLGIRIEGDPAALTRMPPEIADLADGMWQRALKLAGEAAKNEDNAARERLGQIQTENELRAQSFSLREAEWDAAARAREKALTDSREHLLLIMKTLGRDQATLNAREARIADLETQVEHYRREIAQLIARAVAKRRAPASRPLKRRAIEPARRPPRSKSKVRPAKLAKAARPPARKRVTTVPKRRSAVKSHPRRSR
jgi:hypothetical protein